MKPHAWIAALTLLSLCGREASAQSTLEWIDRQSGPGNLSCGASSCLIDGAGNVYTGGGIDLVYTSQVAAGTSLLVKYDSAGNVLWTRSNDVPGAYDASMDIALGSGGIVYQLDSSFPFQWHAQSKVRAWDASGNLQWSVSLPLAFQGFEIAVSPQGQIALPDAQFNGGVTAFTPTGQFLWHTPPIAQGIARLVSDAQGDWYVANYHSGGPPLYPGRGGVSKVSSTGQVLWSHSYVGDWGLYLRDLAAAPDGTTVAAGANESSTAVSRMHVMSHDAAGALLWSHSLPGSGGKDFATDVAIDDDGIAWVVGKQALPVPGIVVVRYSRSGALLSTAFRPGLGLSPIMEPRLVLGNAGQAYVTSSEGSIAKMLLLEVDSTGAFTWAKSQPGGAQRILRVADLALSGSGKLVVAASEWGQLPSMTTLQLDLNDAPQAYCVAKVNSLGCSPKLAFAGLSSAAATSGFQVIASDTLPSTAGLFLYGIAGKAALPFQGGTLCVQSPIRRTPVTQSTAGTGCQSTRSLDFNAFASGTLGGNPVSELKLPGTAVHCQAWSRDPGFPAPNATSLSNALRYVVLP